MNHDEASSEGVQNTSSSLSATTKQPGNGREVSTTVRAFAVIAVLAVGATIAGVLISMRRPPAEAHVKERTLSVEATTVVHEDVPVTVTGLGEVRALNVVPVSPEVAGTIIEIHQNLEMGEVIPKGELLFRIDQRDYLAAKSQAEAQVAQLTNTIQRLEKQFEIDKSRLKTLERSEALMQDEFERTRDLFEKDDVGTKSAVDHAEMNLNQSSDVRDQLAQVIAVYPVQIQEARSALDGARAQLGLAEANLKRTEVFAPFDARIKEVHLEKGQYATPGANVMTLADDQMLEISVSLDSRDAKSWLQFEEKKSEEASSWFGALKPVTCRVSWTEDPDQHSWEGVVHRIEEFDQRNRTISVAIRIPSESASQGSGLPLVAGMFCSVAIPGKIMEDVCRLPRWAVTYDGNAYVIRDGRLAVQEVEIVRSEGEETFVHGNLAEGEQVITTRLVNPLPNTLVAIESAVESEAVDPSEKVDL